MKRHCDLFPEFIHNLDEYNMVGEGQRVLLAVSGGPDSMALLHLFYRWNPERIGVWHLNHGFRKEARQEAEMVRSYCESLGIPVEVCEYDVAALPDPYNSLSFTAHAPFAIGFCRISLHPRAMDVSH